jgi:hypothetical protein
MIATAFFYIIGLVLDILGRIFIFQWTIWPASVERGMTLFGHYCYWLDPWIPMRTFWAIVLYNSSFIIALLPFVIFSRSFRLKLFKHN